MQILAIEGAHFGSVLAQFLEQRESLGARSVAAIVFRIPGFDSPGKSFEFLDPFEELGLWMCDDRQCSMLFDVADDRLRIFAVGEPSRAVAEDVHSILALVLQSDNERKLL